MKPRVQRRLSRPLHEFAPTCRLDQLFENAAVTTTSMWGALEAGEGCRATERVAPLLSLPTGESPGQAGVERALGIMQAEIVARNEYVLQVYRPALA
jgi:hypothetical protein